MLPCPKCSSPLNRVAGEHGIIWCCDACGGRAVNISLLRKLAARRHVNGLWQAALRGQEQPSRPCPACRKPMLETTCGQDDSMLVVHVCRRCQFVWFDATEFEAMPPAEIPVAAERRARELPLAARQLLAEYEVAEIGRRARTDGPYGEVPEEWWKCIPGILGLPIEYDNASIQRLPLATWLIVLITATVSGVAFNDLEEAISDLAMVPDEWWRMGGLTLLSSFFLHGSIMHLTGNMYFLLVFGDNVEDFVGRRCFLLLLLLATLAGDCFHILSDPDSRIPCVGASGGISGVIVFYALQFPHARLGFFFRYLLYFRWIGMPAWSALVLWLIYQVVLAGMQLAGLSNVSAMAHLGGASVGFLFWLWLRGPGDVAPRGP